MFGIPTFDLLSDEGKQGFIEYVVNLARKEINSYTASYNNISQSTMLTDAGLPTVGTAGTYTNVTTDVYGRVVSGTTLVAADIPTLTLAKISDAGTAAAKNIPATGNASATEVVYGSDTRLTNSRTPTAHASTHASAGSDPVTISASQVTGTAIVANDTSYLNPAGSIISYAGINTPSGWLLCDGSSVSRTTYATLFAALSTSFATATTTSTSTTVSGLTGMVSATHVGWGIAGNGIPSAATISSVTNSTTIVISAAATVTAAGSASLVISPYKFTGANNTTTFLVPNLQGNVPVGVKATQTSNPDISTLGATAGAYTYTITANDLPTHTHAVGTLAFTGSAVTSGAGSAHTHTFTGALASFNASHTHADTFAAPAHTHATVGNVSGGFKATNSGTITGSAALLGQSGATLTPRDAGYTTGGASSTTMTGSVTSATTGTGGNLDHTHGLGTLANVNESAHTHSVTAAGTISGSTGNNTTTATAVSLVQPVIALNFIIKT